MKMITATELKSILAEHKLWVETYRVQGTRANLTGANLRDANLTGAIGLPHVSWIIPGCLAQLNKINSFGFFLGKERKYDNFVQDSIGFFIQNNLEEKTFDMLIEDRIIRNIPDWVKLSGLRQTSAEPI